MPTLGAFLQGYETARKGNLDEDQQNLANLLQLQQIQTKQQAAQKEQQFRAEFSAAKTPEERLTIAQKYMVADKLGTSIQSSQDRQATIAATKEAALARVEQAQHNATLLHDARMQALDARNADTATRQAEIERHNKAQEFIGRELLNLRRDSASAAKRPMMTTDEAGNVRLINPNTAEVTATIPRAGKPSEGYVKRNEAIRKSQRDLNEAIHELERAALPGGLIDRSTGSGIGAGVDIGARFVGIATPGAVAAGQLAPIFDLALKMVPRFEGPQSDKDTASYKEAAGNIANPAIPAPQKKAAAQTILRLMKARRGQFVSREFEADIGTTPAPGASPSGVRVVDW